MIVLLLPALLLGADPKRVEVTDISPRMNGQTIIVEGIVVASGAARGGDGATINLRLCNAIFVVPQRVVQNQEIAGSVELTGVVNVEGRQSFVSVEKMTFLKSDADRYAVRAAALKDDPAEWFQLSTWAEHRAKLYQDKAMELNSETAYRRGIVLLREKAAGDPQVLAALKTRIQSEDKLKNYDYDELDHSILLADLSRVKQDDPAAVQKWADDFAKKLPFVSAPCAVQLDVRYREKYDRNAASAYAAAEPEVRKLMYRYLYVKLYRSVMEAERKRGDKSPGELADFAKSRFADYPDIARGWFSEWARLQEGRLHELAESDVDEFVQKIDRELRDYKLSERVRTDWLEFRASALRKAERDAADAAQRRDNAPPPRDPKAWFEIAKTWLKWFPNDDDAKKKATKILLDVYSFAPDFADAQVELRKLDYVYVDPVNGYQPKEAAKTMARKAGRALKPLAVDMSAAEVADALGEPATKSRIATADGVTMHWTYKTTGETLVVVLKGSGDSARVSKLQRIAER